MSSYYDPVDAGEGSDEGHEVDHEVLAYRASYLRDFQRKLMCHEQYMQDPTGQSQNIASQPASDDEVPQDEEEEVPQELKRSYASVGTPRKKYPAKTPVSKSKGVKRVLSFDDSDGNDEEEEDDGPEDQPNLAAYFTLFSSLTEADQVKICRAYANYLASKSTKNRQRWSSKTNNWKNRHQ